MIGLRVALSSFLLVGLWAAAAGAQPTSDKDAARESQPNVSSASRNPEEGSTAKSPTFEERPPTVELPGLNGNAVEVPQDATLEGYFEWLRQQKRDPYDVLSVDISGRINGELAELKVIVTVEVYRDDEWVQVPVGLKEGRLRDFKYQGVGTARPVKPYQADKGQRWWLKGKGRHVLTLPINVTIVKQVPAQRLLLSTPATALSHLTLDVPVPPARLAVKPPKKTHVQKKAKGKAASTIEVWGFGLGTVLDLQWETLPNEAHVETVLHSETTMTLGPTGESVLLEARQKIWASGGSFSDVTVTLPSQFKLLSLKGKQHRDHSYDTKKNSVNVLLEESTKGPIELNWVLAPRTKSPTHTLTVDGFGVAGARNETGEIRIQEFEGFSVIKGEGDETNVYRSNVGAAAGSGKLLRAYRFFAQPFRLVFELREIIPIYTAKPTLFLKFSSDHVELHAKYHFQMLRDGGAISAVELHWPNRKQEGWEIEPIEQPGLIAPFDPDKQPLTGRIHIPLVERMTGDFELSLRARRPISPGEEAIDISLPRAVANTYEPSALLVTGAHNVEVDLQPGEATQTRSLSKERLAEISVPDGFDNPRRQELRIASRAHTFRAKVAVREQTIRTSTTATTILARNQLVVRQRISYDVAWEPLSQIRVTVPAAIEGDVRFFSNEDRASDDKLGNDAGVELATSKTIHDDGSREFRVELPGPEPAIGEFEVVARFVVELPEEPSPAGNVPATVPLIQSADSEYSRVRFRYLKKDRIDARISDEAWIRQLPTGSTTVWRVDEPKTEVPIELYDSDVNPTDVRLVRRALIHTIVDASGRFRSRATYLFDNPVSSIEVFIPPELVAETFWWDRDVVDPKMQIETAPGRYRILLSNDLANGPHLLTIEYHSKQNDPFGTARGHKLLAPQFPQNVWVEQTVWEIVLPDDEHLFTEPAGFTPRYRWERDTLFFHRKGTVSHSQWRQWISAETGPSDRNDLGPGHVYQFSRLGPASSIEFRSVSRSMVVLIGAGMALAVGFLLMKLPSTRNVLTLLIVAFSLSVLGLWYSSPIQLLMQPALLGLLLAATATVIDRAYKRKQTSTVLTLSSASDFVLPSTASSFIQSPVKPVVGSDDPTTLRPTPSPTGEPISSSEAGSSS